MNTQYLNKYNTNKILFDVLILFVMFIPSGYTQSAHVMVAVPYYYIEPDSFFTAKISIDVGERLLGAYQFDFNFNASMVSVDEILGGDSPYFSTLPNYQPDSLANGNFTLAAYQSMSLTEPTGVLNVAKFNCHAIGEPGDSTLIDLTVEVVSDVDGRKMLTDVDKLMVRILSDTMDVFYEFPEPGWYLISIPGALKNPTIAETFPTALGGMACHWQGDRYITTDTLKSQQGYWIAIAEAWSGNITCKPIVGYVQHFLSPGWYMMGTVIRPVDFQDPNDNPPSSILTPIFGYHTSSGEYVASDTLHTKQGYWMAVLQPCDLRIREGESGSGSLLMKASTTESELKMNFENEFGSYPPGPPDIDWKTGKLLTIPKEFALHQNYPNPFNPLTTIQFDLPKEELVKIEIFNVLGKKVCTLVDKKMPAGSHGVIWEAQNSFGEEVASGLYIYQMRAGSFMSVKKLILLR